MLTQFLSLIQISSNLFFIYWYNIFYKKNCNIFTYFDVINFFVKWPRSFDGVLPFLTFHVLISTKYNVTSCTHLTRIGIFSRPLLPNYTILITYRCTFSLIEFLKVSGQYVVHSPRKFTYIRYRVFEMKIFKWVHLYTLLS